jgi:hypothetical protein
MFKACRDRLLRSHSQERNSNQRDQPEFFPYLKASQDSFSGTHLLQAREGPGTLTEGNMPGDSLTKIGASHVKVLRLFLFWGVWLEEDFHRQLCDAGIPHLAGSECAEGVAADFVEGADLVGTIHGAGTNAFRRKVRVVEDVKVLGAQLKPPAFGDQEILGELHVPVDRVRQTENILTDIPKGAKDEGIVDAAHFGRLKSS